jgi:hypothetical protein
MPTPDRTKRRIIFDVRTCSRIVLALVLALSMFVAHAVAQDSKLAVQVADRTGFHLPGVTVTITPVSDCAESGTPAGPVEIVVTNGEGIAAFVTADHHPYRIEAKLTGFTTETTCLRFEPTATPGTTPIVRFIMLVGHLEESVTAPGAWPVVDVQPRNPAPTQEPLPMHSIPQSIPCSDQPKTLAALKAAFNTGRIPSRAESTGEWVAISFFGDDNADLNCTGLVRGSKFEEVMIAHQYALEMYVIGTTDQRPTFEPDHAGSLTFPFSFGGDASPFYRCRLTSRKTLACLIDVYREGVEFKKIRVTPEQVRSCFGGGRC